MKNKLSFLALIMFVLVTFISLNANSLKEKNLTSLDPIKIIRNNQELMLYTNNKITFELGSVELNEMAIYELSVMARKLKLNPNLKIEIGVHNDTRSDIDLSKSITEKRANTIKTFFINRGINPDNLVAIGYGESVILNKCKPFVKCSNSEHNVNKRVELKILNPDELGEYTFVLPKEKELALK